MQVQQLKHLFIIKGNLFKTKLDVSKNVIAFEMYEIPHRPLIRTSVYLNL